MSFTPSKLDKVVFPSSVEFSQIHNARWGAEIESLIERPAGHPHPMFRGNRMQKPVFEFTTSDLKTLIANVGVGGASIASTTSTYFKLAATTGNVARATTSHKRINIAQGLLYWTTITLPHNGRGEAQVVFVATYDGSNDPFVYAGSVALSGNITAASYWGAGPVAINGTEVPGVQQVEISSGVRLIEAGEASVPWNSFVGVEMTEPSITIRVAQERNWSTFGLAGTALDGSTGVVAFGRKFAAQGRVAPATTSHLKFSGANGSVIPVDSSGQESGPITDTLRCELLAASDSTVPLTLAVDQAIS